MGIVDSQGHSHGKSKLEELSAGRYSAKRKMGGGCEGDDGRSCVSNPKKIGKKEMTRPR